MVHASGACSYLKFMPVHLIYDAEIYHFFRIRMRVETIDQPPALGTRLDVHAYGNCR